MFNVIDTGQVYPIMVEFFLSSVYITHQFLKFFFSLNADAQVKMCSGY